MRVFLLDLWLDLREKRLAPVAILLLAGIIAVPLVLAKGTKPAPTPAPTPTKSAAAAAPVIQSQPQAGPVESKLQTFSPRDPFEPTARVVAAGAAGSTATGGTGGGTRTTTTTTTPTTTGTTGGGGATTGTGPTTGTGNTGAGGNTGNTTGQTKTTLFTYTVDVRFGQAGSVKMYKDVKRLDLLPTPKNPKLDFLGVTTTGKTAVFLVSSNIGVDTPGGKCQPSPNNCTFLYLRPDKGHNEAILTDSDGTVYHLRLVKINRVTVSSSNGTTNSGTGNTNTGSGKKKRSSAFTGSVDKGSKSSSTNNSSNTVPGNGEAPPGEPSQPSSFQQAFADSGSGGSGGSGK